MKRLLLGVATVLGAALLGGCPIYPATSDYPSCGSDGQCYDCPNGSTPSDNTCIPWQCGSSSDCPSGYVCSANSCVAAPDAGDCSAGCASGYICKLAGGQTQCVPVSSLGSDDGSAASADAGATSVDASGAIQIEAGAEDAAATTDSSRPDASSSSSPEASVGTPDARSTEGPLDAAGAVDSAVLSDVLVGQDAPLAPIASDASDGSVAAACNANSDCGGDGAKCIDGLCTPQSELCSDTTQCVTAGESCVDGVCEPHCSVNAPCPGGYECDFSRGVCNLNAQPCSGSGASSCQGGSTCVEGRCVPPCAADDSGIGSCPGGQVCVNGGCIPDEAAQFSCLNDGQGGQLATACSPTSVCLHHDCYAGCSPDGDAGGCADPTSLCKPVTVTAGTYDVCATASNLGSDCDPAAGKYCSGGVCVDGFCR
jgi:Cys-rich repeat protein